MRISVYIQSVVIIMPLELRVCPCRAATPHPQRRPLLGEHKPGRIKRAALSLQHLNYYIFIPYIIPDPLKPKLLVGGLGVSPRVGSAEAPAQSTATFRA